MKLLTTLLIVGVLSACTSQPINVPGWEEQERAATDDIQGPVAIPDFPAAIVVGEGEKVFINQERLEIGEGALIFTDEGRVEIEQYQAVAEGNYDIAQANANALVASAGAYNALIDAGIYQEKLAIFRQELLEEERKNHFWDNIFHRLVIVALSIGLVL